jgi:hypothetical protein
MNTDEVSQRNMIGSLIYPYVNLILKQLPAGGAPSGVQDAS